MRRALVGTALTAIALFVIAEPAQAAPAAPADLGSPTIATDKSAGAFWETAPINTSTGFKVKTWSVDFDISSTDGRLLNVSSCVDFYDSNTNLQKETCTAGQTTSGFSYTLDATGLTHASVRKTGIPGQTCSTDANGQLIGQCKPAAISVKATWTGQGPITYSKYIEYVPNVYRIVSQGKSRNADASATFNGKAPAGQFADAFLSTRSPRRGETLAARQAGVPCPTGVDPPPHAPKCRSGADLVTSRSGHRKIKT